MATHRPLPPIWLMGMGFFPLGATGSILVITVPQLMAADHTPEQKIASVTAIALTPTFFGFLLTPLLDWRLSRRTYAIGFCLLSAFTQFLALLFIHDIPFLTAMLLVSELAVTLVVAAVGGWFGNLTGAEQKGSLGAWFTVANLGAGGMVASVAIYMLRDMPYVLGAALLSLTILLSVPLYLYVECPPADRRLAGESFRAFALDVLALLRKPSVLWTLLLFLMPCASFALTNVLAGFGRDFHTSEAMVGLIGGMGVSLAGVVGSLAIAPLATRVEPRALYLLVGAFGAAFTFVTVFLAHTPAIYGLSSIGENLFQAAAFSVANTVILRTIGRDNPLAATQFWLLIAAIELPLIYMQAIDGHFYGFGGVSGSFLADAAFSGAACLVIGAAYWSLRRTIPKI
jgi:PAT family beta-lactamase induction signal transducer AmpG